MGGFSRWQLFKIWVAYQFGKHTALPESNYFTTNDVTVEIEPAQYVDVDGEVTTLTPVRFTVAEEALKVMAPLDFE
jgi:diacylglycerol kinase family enzyme